MNVNLFSKYLNGSALKYNQKLVTKLPFSVYIIQVMYCHFLNKFSNLLFSVFVTDTHNHRSSPHKGEQTEKMLFEGLCM